MDDKDQAILRILRKDSRTSFLSIAKDLGVSEGTIRKRVKDLQAAGIITRFTVETEGDVFAIVGIETETKMASKKIIEKLRELSLGALYEVTGRFDIVAHVPHVSLDHVNEVLEQIRAIPGVLHTETFTVLHKN